MEAFLIFLAGDSQVKDQFISKTFGCDTQEYIHNYIKGQRIYIVHILSEGFSYKLSEEYTKETFVYAFDEKSLEIKDAIDYREATVIDVENIFA
jgi:hypothetical protein